MAPPLLASAFTTLSAAAALTTCQLTALYKMGHFLAVSTLWSLAVSLWLLPLLLARCAAAPGQRWTRPTRAAAAGPADGACDVQLEL